LNHQLQLKTCISNFDSRHKVGLVLKVCYKCKKIGYLAQDCTSINVEAIVHENEHAPSTNNSKSKWWVLQLLNEKCPWGTVVNIRLLNKVFINIFLNQICLEQGKCKQNNEQVAIK